MSKILYRTYVRRFLFSIPSVTRWVMFVDEKATQKNRFKNPKHSASKGGKFGTVNNQKDADHSHSSIFAHGPQKMLRMHKHF